MNFVEKYEENVKLMMDSLRNGNLMNIPENFSTCTNKLEEIGKIKNFCVKLNRIQSSLMTNVKHMKLEIVGIGETDETSETTDLPNPTKRKNQRDELCPENESDDKFDSKRSRLENFDLKSDHFKQHINKSYCYICKQTITSDAFHDFYKLMCVDCGTINLFKRNQSKDLTGKFAIVTGGRIKIGFETALKLLRSNCKVLVTSRFSQDALCRYIAQDDHESWIHNLSIFEVNFLDGNSLLSFVDHVVNHCDRIDILVNNAAQTLSRPLDFYKHLGRSIPPADKLCHIVNFRQTDNVHQSPILQVEQLERSNESDVLVELVGSVVPTGSELVPVQKPTSAAQFCLSTEYVRQNPTVSDPTFFPMNKVDEFGQQLDLRRSNSWMLEIDQIDIDELLSVYAINSATPFILISKFSHRMNRDSWIINVTSMEGIFNSAKTTQHVHTNMAKASLNMMTKTSGKYLFEKYGITMIAVETGWNNPQQPNSYEFKTPLDCVDAAARILDPVYCGLKKTGIIYKDYKITDW